MIWQLEFDELYQREKLARERLQEPPVVPFRVGQTALLLQ